VEKVFQGHNLTTCPNDRHHLSHSVLCGDALAAFEAAATNCGNVTIEHLSQVFNDVINHTPPQKIGPNAEALEALFTPKVH
jgi:hypothetical protein